MAKRKNKKIKRVQKENKQEDSRLFAFLAAFLSIIGFVIALIAKREDKYVMYYAKQSLVIFIIGAIAGIISKILSWIPIMGRIIHFGLSILIFILWLVSWIYALSGEQKHIPIVSDYAEKIDL